MEKREYKSVIIVRRFKYNLLCAGAGICSKDVSQHRFKLIIAKTNIRNKGNSNWRFSLNPYDRFMKLRYWKQHFPVLSIVITNVSWIFNDCDIMAHNAVYSFCFKWCYNLSIIYAPIIETFHVFWFVPTINISAKRKEERSKLSTVLM